MSLLQTLGKDAKAVFEWLGSSKGQATVQTVEGAAEVATTAISPAAGAALTTGFALLNNWMTEIVKEETIAAAAAQQNGSGPQKSAAVVAAMEPQLLAFLQSQGITSAQVSAKAQTITTALVSVLNTLDAPTAKAS